MLTRWLILASIFAGSAVILGAFAAHGLRGKLTERALEVFHTGVQYQFYHALGILALALLTERLSSSWLTIAGYSWALGIVLFSGSLYLLAITGIKWFGPITPLGGVLFILGWVSLLMAAVKA